MSVRADYLAAITALETYRNSAEAAQPGATALKSATLANASTSAENALAAIKGAMEDERTGNLLATLGL